MKCKPKTFKTNKQTNTHTHTYLYTYYQASCAILIFEILTFGILIFLLHLITDSRFNWSKETAKLVSFLQTYHSKDDLMLRICCYNYACNRFAKTGQFVTNYNKADSKAHAFLNGKLFEFAKLQKKGVRFM